MSLFIDSGAGSCKIYIVHFSPIYILCSIEQRKHFITAKLKIWVWYGVAIMIGQISYVFTDASKQITYMVKHLNYV